MPGSEYVLELKGITKIFPGVKALNKVQFQLRPGEVHALMGENGAGKSTFIKVITGVHKAEEGEMFLNGQKVDFKGPRDAQAAGIAAVYQHATSYPDLTVAENIFMGHEIIRHGIIQWKQMNEEANTIRRISTSTIISALARRSRSARSSFSRNGWAWTTSSPGCSRGTRRGTCSTSPGRSRRRRRWAPRGTSWRGWWRTRSPTS